jgi:hypothetical protein
MNPIAQKIKEDLKNDMLFYLLLPKINKHIDTPDKDYGMISPSYSIMTEIFDYYDVDELTDEQRDYAAKVVNIVDNAFGTSWKDLSAKMQLNQQERQLKLLKQLYSK